jgi:dTDP-4-dehydrorhamnose reductase
MILLLGKNGYVSKRFQDFFALKKIDFVVESLRDFNKKKVVSLLQKYKPSSVINCIGYTGVPNTDECENNKPECLSVNSVLPTLLASVCSDMNIVFLHVSTGCIYQDYTEEYPTLFTEDCFPNFSFYHKNCSWYSGTKELGESMVRSTGKRYYIMRLRMPFNHIPHSKNYLSKLLKYPKVWSRNNSITNLDEFVLSCYLALQNNVPYGTYNLINKNPTNAEKILETAQKYGFKNDCEIIKDSEKMKTITQSPRSDCTLSTEKSESCGIQLLSIEESISRCFNYWNKDSSPFWP